MWSNSSKALQVVDQVADGESVWLPQVRVERSTAVRHRDVMFTIGIALVGLFTNQIVPYPSNKPYEYYTLSNDVVFTMTLSKALRKTLLEIEEACDPQLIRNASGKQVLCYGDWGICPFHIAHCQAPDFAVKWRADGISEKCQVFVFTVSKFAAVDVLTSFFPELLQHGESRSALQSNINVLRGQCLLGACCGGHMSLVKRLTALGIDVDSSNNDGCTPVCIAAANGHVAVIKTLAALGANIDTPRNDRATPVYIAAYHGHVDVIKTLAALGANVDTPRKDGATPVYIAAQEGHVDVIKTLATLGAIVDTPRNNGATPVYIAAANGHVDVIKTLATLGANVDTPRKDGATPVYIAAEWGHVDVIKALAALGANINSPIDNVAIAEMYGSTPLAVAKKGNHESCVKFLLGALKNTRLP